jgi:hypothetical protein
MPAKICGRFPEPFGKVKVRDRNNATSTAEDSSGTDDDTTPQPQKN